MPASFDPRILLEKLVSHGVDFVVIGGFAAWMHGAAIVTVDLDIVYDPHPENLTRLVNALRELDAVYRHQHGRRIQPTIESLRPGPGAGHHLLATRHGGLDALLTAAGHGYDTLKDDVDIYEIGDIRVPIVKLERIIELKSAAGRPKDVAALPVLRAALKENNDQGNK